MNIIDPNLNLTVEPTANREFKNSLFTLLLDDVEAIRDVAHAIFGDEAGPNAKIEKTTLVNIFRGKWRNDLSFLLNGQLIVLIEHQSTLNENMPLRMLYYICETYKRFFSDKDLYDEDRKTIPEPYFIVLYNGERAMEKDYVEYRLSDMFAGFDRTKKKPWLELIVHAYDINKGHSADMVNKSRILRGYSALIAKIREHKKTMSLDDAIKKAVNECLKEGILADFLNKHKAEVIDMLVTEWNFDLEMEVREEKGVRKGRQEQLRENVSSMYQEGLGVDAIARLLRLPEKDIQDILGL
jgi:predicted transposase/invertase (TIGR01784 family)